MAKSKKLQVVENPPAVVETAVAKPAEIVQQPEAPKARTAQDINNDYAELCKMLGDKITKLRGLQAEVEAINSQIGKLGEEMTALQQKAGS
jgi:peptidoglycan hydrolase CwlO-like protein